MNILNINKPRQYILLGFDDCDGSSYNLLTCFLTRGILKNSKAKLKMKVKKIKLNPDNKIGSINALIRGLEVAQQQELTATDGLNIAESISSQNSEFAPEFKVGVHPHWDAASKSSLKTEIVVEYSPYEEYDCGWVDDDGNPALDEIPETWEVGMNTYDSLGRLFSTIKKQSFDDIEQAKAYFQSFYG